jgi:hypothetical protein
MGRHDIANYADFKLNVEDYFMKLLFAGVLLNLLFLSHQSQAGSAKDAASHKQEDANPLKLKNFEDLKGRFFQVKTLKELGVEIKSEGNFQVSRKSEKDRIFHWNVEKPKPSKVCIDAKGIALESNGSVKKISFSEMGPDSGEQMSSLLKLISLDPSQLPQDFKIEAIGPDFLLTPLKPETVFFQTALVHVDAKGLVDHLVLKEKSQDELKVQFKNLSTEKFKLESCAL